MIQYQIIPFPDDTRHGTWEPSEMAPVLSIQDLRQYFPIDGRGLSVKKRHHSIGHVEPGNT